MRTHARLTAAAAVAATVTALAGLAQAGPASGATASDHGSLVAAAIASAKSHVAATRFGTAQALTAVGTIVDADGTSHVRLHRTYHGLEVIGGVALLGLRMTSIDVIGVRHVLWHATITTQESGIRKRDSGIRGIRMERR